MRSLIAVFARVGSNRRERLFEVFLKTRAMPANHEQVDRHAVLVAEGRMGQPVAADVSQLELAQGQRTVRLIRNFAVRRPWPGSCGALGAGKGFEGFRYPQETGRRGATTQVVPRIEGDGQRGESASNERALSEVRRRR